jgi:hypothetical protein
MAGRPEAGEGTTASLLSEVVIGLGRLLQGELRLARAEAAAGLKTAGWDWRSLPWRWSQVWSA